MAVAHVASAVSGTLGTTTCTITIPAGTATDDDLYVQVAINENAANSLSVTCTDDDSGGNTWTLICRGTNDNSFLFWKKATSATASKTITIAGAQDTVCAGVAVYRGAASGNPTTNLSYEDNASGNETHAALTPISSGSMICLAVFNQTNDLLVTSPACTDPGALSARFEATSTGGADCQTVHASALQSAGPTATGAFTWAQTNAATESMSWAIKPPLAVALTGTATATIDEDDITAGGKTVIATLIGDTYIAAAPALAYVGGQGAGFAGTTSAQTINFALTNGTDRSPQAGDLVVIAYSVGSTVDRSLAIRNTSAVDYTLAGSELTQSDTFDANLRVAYRFMPATPETQFVLTETVGGGTGNANDAGRYTVHVFRNVDVSTPMDVAVVTAGAIDTRIVNPGSITPSTSGAWVYGAGGAAGGTGGTFTSSDLTGDFRAGSTADINDAMIGAGYAVWTSGAFNPAAFGGGGTDTTSDSWCAITLALRPSSGTFDSSRQAFINGFDSAQSEGTGWDAEVKAKAATSEVVRTSSTVVTWTIGAQAGYNITAQETITGTIPASILQGAVEVVASPTFTIDTAGGASVGSGAIASDGEGALTGIGASTAASAIGIDGDGQLSAVGAALAASVFSTDGEGDFQAVGAEVISGALNAEGEAELAASGASIASSILNIDGESEFTATGASIATCVLNADGEAEFVAEGSSISDGSGVFEATGEGEFTAVGASIADGALTAEGEGDFIVVSEAVVTPGTPEATVSPRPDGGGAYAHDANPWARINARKKKQMREEDEDFLAALRELAPHIFNSRTIH